MKPKYKVGDKIKVCGDIETIVESIEDLMGLPKYWFIDPETNKRHYEFEEAIELVKPNHSTEETVSFKTPDNWKEKESIVYANLFNSKNEPLEIDPTYNLK